MIASSDRNPEVAANTRHTYPAPPDGPKAIILVHRSSRQFGSAAYRSKSDDCQRQQHGQAHYDAPQPITVKRRLRRSSEAVDCSETYGDPRNRDRRGRDEQVQRAVRGGGRNRERAGHGKGPQFGKHEYARHADGCHSGPFVQAPPLGVWSHRVVGWNDSEACWLGCPDFADEFERREALLRLQSACVVLGCDETA